MLNNNLQFGVIGAGGFGREVAALLSSLGYSVIGFWDDKLKTDTLVNSLPILGTIDQARPEITPNLVIAIANPQVRLQLAEVLKNRGFSFPAIVSKSQMLDASVEIAQGAIVFKGSTLTANVKVEEFAIVHGHCFLGHDAHIGRFSTLMPGCIISGGSQIGQEVYAGTGVKFIKPVKVPEKTKILAGSIVDETFVFSPTPVK